MVAEKPASYLTSEKRKGTWLGHFTPRGNLEKPANRISMSQGRERKPEDPEKPTQAPRVQIAPGSNPGPFTVGK